MGGEGGSHHREGAIALAAASVEVANLFIMEREAGSYRTAADGRQEERCRCGTESNFASHEPLTAPFHTTPRPGHAPRRPRTHSFGLKEQILEGNLMSGETMGIHP